MDISGKILTSKILSGKTSETIDMSGYPSGIFILKTVNVKGEIQLTKIVRN
jgi:hypothetical protein